MPELTPEQVASARADWVAAGLSGEAFDRAAAPDLTGDNSADRVPAAGGDIHPSQASGMVQGLVNAGVSKEAIKAALQGDGFTPEQIAGLLPDATPGSADLQAFDRTFAGAKPEDYGAVVPYSVASIVGDKIAEATQEWADNLSRMGVSTAAGPAIVEAAIQQGQRWAAMDADQRRAAASRLDGDLIAVGGDEAGAKALVEAAQSALAKATPEFRSQVMANGGLLDAAVIVTLAMATKHAATRTQLQSGKRLSEITTQ